VKFLYERTILSNGLRVLSQKIPGIKSVSVGIFIGAGSRYEPPKIAGISHFIEHMLFKGTTQRPKPQMISEEIESVGGILNASTDKEVTIFYTKVGGNHFVKSLDVLMDMIQNPIFLPEEIERERSVILEELSMTYDLPDALADLLIDQALWPSQPMGTDVGGTRETVNSITKAHLNDYHANQYVPSNIVIAVAGDVEHDYLLREINSRMSSIYDQPRKFEIEPVKQAYSNTISVVLNEKPTEQTHFCLAFNGVAITNVDSYALDMLSTVLGEGMTSRLFLEVRENLGLAYDIHSSSIHYSDCGATVIGCGSDSAKVDQTIAAILRELRETKIHVSARELSRAIEYSIGRLHLRMEDTRAVMIWLGAQEILKGDIITVDEIESKLRSITTEDLRVAAENYIDFGMSRLSVVGPHSDKHEFEQLLSSII
jgi:predicted Zn-dependent peptidase